MEELLDNTLGVRISPSLVHFMDALVGQSYRAALTVQNISHVAKSIKILEPEDPQFSLTVKNPDKAIASGLQVTAKVEYRPKDKEDIRDRIRVLVDNDVIDIPLLGFTPSCYLEIDEEVNFGALIANNKVIYKDFHIMNHGTSPGVFKIKYSGHLPITILPSSGTVEPKAMQSVRVELCADKPRTISETAKIKLEGRDEIILQIKGSIVNQNLELLDMAGKHLKCVHFGPVYFGTSKTHEAIIYNNSPEELKWVSVLDDRAAGLEMGTDIHCSTDAVLENIDYIDMTRETDVSSLISCSPNQGVLLPYEKKIITIFFKPKQVCENIRSDDFPSQLDYALFLRFEPGGRECDLLQTQLDSSPGNKEPKRNVELAITGSAVPVTLTFSPGPVYNFKECLIGEQIDILCSLKNESPFLPVAFNFRKISHFHISPFKGSIEPGHAQDVMFSFLPHQIGTFNVKQVVDISGPTSENISLPLKMKAFHQKRLTFTAVCKPVTNKIVMRVNPGITPLVSNATGQFVQASEEDTAMYTGATRIATMKAANTHIHDHHVKSDTDKEILIAYPNDRAASIRPSDPQTQYRTIFTKVERYSYVDPDYAYTEFEENQKKTHKDYYANYIKSRRQQRLEREKEREFEDANNPVDIGITPASGLYPPRISVTGNISEPQTHRTAPKTKGRMLTTCQLADGESISLTKQITDGLNAIPCTAAQKKDCSLKLTPQQLHHIVIGPSTVDFGDVCVGSLSTKEINIINSLSTYIWVQVEIDCEELQQTCPLSHVVPPTSKTAIPVVFETNSLGKCKKSISYTVNNDHTGHILITAKAVPVALELSTHKLVLRPNCNFLAETGFRSSVRLYNHRNHLAEFSWKPVIAEKGIAFSIRPARGTVEAHKDLECEVVWHPGFGSPDIGEFNLCVQQGNTQKLKCIAELGSTSVQLTEQRVLFHQAPLGLPSCKTAILQNTGMNHAYFQVIDVSPLPGMTITPSQGIVPVGGHVTLRIFFTPKAILKFDTRVEVSVRNTKPLELRIGGSVVAPVIDISVSSFLFPGVYVNSTQGIPFLLQNKSVARAKVEFDLSKYQDFSMSFKDDSVVDADRVCPHLYAVELDGKKSLQCTLYFNPKDVAAYDFQLPININFTGDLSHADSSVPVSPTPSEKHIVTPRPQMVNVISPACRVNATVLRQLISFSSTKFEFEVPSGILDLGVEDGSLCSKRLELTNISKQTVTWKLKLDKVGKVIEDGVFRFSRHAGTLQPGEVNIISLAFCPSHPGNYMAEIPVILNNNPDNHFTPLRLFGSIKAAKLIFDPPLVIMTPVPLDAKTQATVDIIPVDFFRPSELKVEIPDVELENGDRVKLFSLHFPNGQAVVSPGGSSSNRLICQITFKSPRSVSCFVELLFTDEYNNRFSLPVAAVAENCILTVYPHLAYHNTDQQVILRSGHNSQCFGEAVLHPRHVPETPSMSTSSSSLGAATNSTYEASLLDEDSYTDNEKPPFQRTKDKFELSFFPEEDTEEGIFFQKVLTAVQMWFSLFGWAAGCNPISIPHSLWSGVCKIQLSKPEGKITKTINLGKETKTIYDMLFYLSGQMLPGITASQSLPSDPTERVLQLHWQHATLLTFLKSQGAFLPHIRPEFLLEPQDYKRWLQIQIQLKELQYPDKKTINPRDRDLLQIDSNTFMSVSKRSWTDVLLQIYKVLILSPLPLKKSSSNIISESMPKISSEPLSSNIYSTSERILLTCLNVHYEKMRKIVWKNCEKGGIPMTRWVINFDKDLLDGLVLSAQVAAYCPYLIPTHFACMYTNPKTAEECLHNCLIFANALRTIHLDIDIQATDICDPNPILMLMLCVYLHEKLPLYLPKKTVSFDGALHENISRQVRLKNPSSKPLVYNATIVGQESADFSLPKGNTITLAPKSQVDVTLEYRGRFLQPTEATLLLVSRSASGVGGTTMSFALQSQVTKIAPTGTCKEESPCYELNKISLSVQSPYKARGKFRVILVESTSYLSSSDHLQKISDLMQRKVCSDGFPEDRLSHVICKTNNANTTHNKEYQSNLLHQFFCPVSSVFLEEGFPASLQINFLPFGLGNRYCTVIFSNEQIGDFIYVIEATGTPPLPSALIPVDSPNILHLSNNISGCTKPQNITYFKCIQTTVLEENLKIPLVNEGREKALATAAQMQMTSLEYERRKITGTLESSSVRAAVAILGQNRTEDKSLCRSSSFSSCSKKMNLIDYDVKTSMPEHFEIPEKIAIPVSAKTQLATKQVSVEGDYPVKEQENGVLLPVRFVPGKPGRYPCQVLLHSYHDVRVYMIECVVNPTSAETELEFITPACEAVVQEIPISNMTQQNWKLNAVLEGDGFYGPPVLFIPAGEKGQYCLMFKPISQCVCTGKLILKNETDGTEHIFGLKGIGQEPLALDHVIIDCQVRQITQKVLMVPNYTNNTLTFKVMSDLPIVGGPQSITVKPGTSAPYSMDVSPWKRGLFQGVILFVVEEENQQFQHGSFPEHTDGQGRKSSPYRVWFSVEINSRPAPPERTIHVTCAVLETVGIDIPISNPMNEILPLLVLVNGDGLTGDTSITLQRRETFPYKIEYSPTRTGITFGSVILQSDVCGEFWYELQLKSEKPLPTTLRTVPCELGKWMRVYIPLHNPTQDILELQAVNSNPENFLVEVDPNKPILVPSQTTSEVAVKFCPSALGKGNHRASITFKNPQVEEWVFHVSGVGLIPQPMESVSICASVGNLSSIIISFRNPTDEHVLIDVILTDQEQTMHRLSASILRHSINKQPAFSLPLKQTQAIALAPKEKFDIPVLFAPDTMKLYEALVVVHMVKADGETWAQDLEESVTELKSITRTEEGAISGIRWIYPVHGIPEASPSKSSPAVVSCQARSRTEERIEVLLTGAVPGQTAMPGNKSCMRQGEMSNQIQEEVQVGNGFHTAEEFSYEMRYDSEEVKSHLESSVAIELLGKERDAPTGIVTLIFNIIFAPNKTMRHSATLVVQCATGGIWKFPIKLVATEPDVDDTIHIEAIGLNKESVVGFRLTSQTRFPEPFSAYFLSGSDLEFSVSPQTGELLPLGTTGTLITVGFKPTMYSKKHKATLVVQTAAMQWTYEIIGVDPKTTPRTNVSPKICSRNIKQPTSGKRRNYIRENLKLITTSVSSPIKGAPLVFRTK